MITVAHNLAALNTQNQFKINENKKKKSMEKLSSGYRINRAADDAAGLAISQKLRRQIRGLTQGTKNAQDGVSWVQIGDGALNEVDDMLHRMTELSVQSLNDTYTAEDRAYMQAEFDKLQSEIDHVTHSATFNEKHIFRDHETTYYQCEGNAIWENAELHSVHVPKNTLIVEYTMDEESPKKQVEIEIPEGEYTTQELADEIEDALIASGAADDGLYFELTGEGNFNMNLEGGIHIGDISGGLSYLMYDMYEGGAVGALIGTTVFPTEDSRLHITSGRNDNMTFNVEDFDGHSSTVSLTLEPGDYTRNQLIDLLNDKLSGTTIRASKHGTGIMLGSDDAIISKFKGNMFQIDGSLYTSVFYDNINYGEVSLSPGVFTGGNVLLTSNTTPPDTEHQQYDIKAGVNDSLTFKANGAENAVTISIPEGRYSNTGMVEKLNELFNSNNLDLTATTNPGVTASGRTFSGITITSKLKGAGSSVGLDSASSAYDTLFVKREYNVYANDAVLTNETTEDRTASFTGGKPFLGRSGYTYENLPLTITAGSNDKFNINVNGNAYTVQLDAGTYSNVGSIVSAIQNKLDSSATLGDYAGKLQVSSTSNGTYSGMIRIEARDGSGVSNISASAVSGNAGYKDIFTTSINVTERVVSGESYTTEKTFPNPTSISPGENTITVTSTDGRVSYDITLPTGDGITHDQIRDAVNASTDVSQEFDNRFTGGGTYSGNNNTVTSSGRPNGNTTVTPASYSSTGTTTGAAEGFVGDNVNTPAKVTVALKASFTPGDGTDGVGITLNGVTKNFTFDHITYTPATFAAALQSKIDEAYGTNYGGATVTASGNDIVITSRLNLPGGGEGYGSETNISLGNSTSSLLTELNTARTNAYVNTSRALNSSITITSGVNDTFNYTYNGAQKSVTLNAGTYDRQSFAQMLDTKLEGTGVSASVSGTALKLQTDNAGSQYSINYSSSNGGNSAEALFGPLSTAASTTTSAMQSTFEIKEDARNFTYTVNGSQKTVQLDVGSYTPSSFVTMLNNKLTDATASLTSSNGLRLTSNATGSSATIGISYDSSSSSAMRAIWGTTTVTAPAVTASFDDDNHLILTGDDGRTFRMSSQTSGIVSDNRTPVTNTPSTVSGYSSTTHASLDGVDLNISSSSPLVIDEWNNKLSFSYYTGVSGNTGTRRLVDINVAQGTYTSYEALQNELQSKLDSSAGTGQLKTTVDEHGVRIEAVKAGSTVRIGNPNYTDSNLGYSGFSTKTNFGSFYDKVMCTFKEESINQTATNKDGSNTADSSFGIPYAVGRKNVRTVPVNIVKDVNDTLTLDFEYPTGSGSKTSTYTMKLSEGVYNADTLKAEIQKKLNEQLVADGLLADTIEVDVGRIHNNIAGSNDDNALNFVLSSKVTLPGAGKYVIDGIGGNAAFSVFYQTEGDLVPAYIAGARDITQGITINEDETQLSFKTDDSTYTIELEPKEYTADELIDEINSQLSDQSSPVKAEISDAGTLKLTQKKMGNHPITEVNGSARQILMFNEGGETGAEREIHIQLSSDTNDSLTIDRPPASTAFLGINTITVTRPKYAMKALERVKDALKLVADMRTTFGAEQNRLEHSISGNNNTSENTEAADMRLADTDMAKESVALATQNILMQATEAMLAQNNNTAQWVLQLLQ